MPSVRSLCSTLSSNPWFASLPRQLRLDMLVACEFQHLSPGSMLFRQGDSASGFYVLIHGHIKMSTLNEDGREAILAVIDHGTWFGEISLIDHCRRTHDATAMEPSEVAVMSVADFKRFMLRASFANGIARMLASRIRVLYGLVEDSHLRSPAARIARRLLLLSNGAVSGHQQNQSMIPVSQESLAMMLGMSRQTLSKELQLMQQLALIRLGYRCIEILSPEKLLLHSRH